MGETNGRRSLDRPDGTAAAIRFIPALSGLRGIAAVWVVCFHVQQLLNARGIAIKPRRFEIVLESGWVGVDLFFVLSGFMLAHSHARQFDRLGWRPIATFLRTRFLRVYPLSLAALAFVGALVAIDQPFAAHFVRNAPGNLSGAAFIQTALLATRWLPPHGDWNQPIWSLSVEVIGYLAFPFLLWGALKVRSPLACCGLAAIPVATYVMHLWSRYDIATNEINNPYAMARMMAYFSAGVFCQVAVRQLVVNRRRIGEVLALSAGGGCLLLAQVNYGTDLCRCCS